MQVRADFDGDLAAEHEALQAGRQGHRIGIGQQKPVRLIGQLQQREQRDHAAFRRQPAVPVPMAGLQLRHVVHELCLRKRRRIPPVSAIDMVGQCENQTGRGLRVVMHGGGI